MGPTLTKTSHIDFARRHNSNGTTDSICLTCFQTIATEPEELDLGTQEIAHQCKGFQLGVMLHPESQKYGSW